MNLDSTMKRSIFAPPDVLPAHAPMNIMIRMATMARGPQVVKPGAAIPVEEIIDTVWNNGLTVTSRTLRYFPWIMTSAVRHTYPASTIQQ